MCVCLHVQSARRENMGFIVHKTVHATTMGPATVLLAPAAVLLDTIVTPVNTVCTPSIITQDKLCQKVTSDLSDTLK